MLDLHVGARRDARVSLPVCPLPSLGGRTPAIVHQNDTGVVLAYARISDDDMLVACPVGTPNGSLRHFMPDATPVFAVHDGVIIYAGPQAHGHAIVVDHENGWATYYADLEHAFATPTSKRPRPERVKAGDVLGHVGNIGPDTLKCLHFELWHRADGVHFGAVPPAKHVAEWPVLPWSDDRITPIAA